jgi:hypothetical protein
VNTEVTQLSTPPVAREKTVSLRPSFFGALRGVWLFTWKSQLTWKRVPILLIGLLVLPLLVYMTISPRASQNRSSLWIGNINNPIREVQNFRGSLASVNLQLPREQRVGLERIFSEEFASADSAWREMSASEPDVDEQIRQIQACYERIRNRAQTVLDDRQFAQFGVFQNTTLQSNQTRLTSLRWSRSAAFCHWLIDFYFFVILPLNCVRACGGLIRDELQTDTLCFLTTRPLSRARLLAIKYLCQTGWLQIVMLIETLLLFAVGHLLHIPALGALIPVFLATQFLAVLAWSALGTLLGQVTKRYMALAMVYGLIVEMGIGSIPTNINTLSLMRHLKTLLAHNAALQNIYEWSVNRIPVSMGALALATGIFLSLAMLLFTFKEYHHTVEMQK